MIKRILKRALKELDKIEKQKEELNNTITWFQDYQRYVKSQNEELHNAAEKHADNEELGLDE